METINDKWSTSNFLTSFSLSNKSASLFLCCCFFFTNYDNFYKYLFRKFFSLHHFYFQDAPTFIIYTKQKEIIIIVLYSALFQRSFTLITIFESFISVKTKEFCMFGLSPLFRLYSPLYYFFSNLILSEIKLSCKSVLFSK